MLLASTVPVMFCIEWYFEFCVVELDTYCGGGELDADFIFSIVLSFIFS